MEPLPQKSKRTTKQKYLTCVLQNQTRNDLQREGAAPGCAPSAGKAADHEKAPGPKKQRKALLLRVGSRFLVWLSMFLSGCLWVFCVFLCVFVCFFYIFCVFLCFLCFFGREPNEIRHSFWDVLDSFPGFVQNQAQW